MSRGLGDVYKRQTLDNEKDDEITTLPELSVNQALKLKKIEPKQSFTEPPARYTEATLVKSLEEKGIKIAVNSNKRGDYTSALVNKYFSQFPWVAVYGEREREGIPKKPDPSAALEIANHMNLPAEEVLYIGDSKTDMETGQNAKMDTIGVAWGFRGAEELRENNATYIVEKPEAILEYVI